MAEAPQIKEHRPFEKEEARMFLWGQGFSGLLHNISKVGTFYFPNVTSNVSSECY